MDDVEFEHVEPTEHGKQLLAAKAPRVLAKVAKACAGNFSSFIQSLHSDLILALQVTPELLGRKLPYLPVLHWSSTSSPLRL